MDKVDHWGKRILYSKVRSITMCDFYVFYGFRIRACIVSCLDGKWFNGDYKDFKMACSDSVWLTASELPPCLPRKLKYPMPPKNRHVRLPQEEKKLEKKK